MTKIHVPYIIVFDQQEDDQKPCTLHGLVDVIELVLFNVASRAHRFFISSAIGHQTYDHSDIYISLDTLSDKQQGVFYMHRWTLPPELRPLPVYTIVCDQQQDDQ